jgi:hypothetical protein
MKVFCQNKRFNQNKIMQFSNVLSPLWFFPDAIQFLEIYANRSLLLPCFSGVKNLGLN